MTRAKIIADIARLPDFDTLLNKIFPTQPDLKDDLRQEALLVLCEMPEQRLMYLYNEGKLKYYFLGTLRLMAVSKYSRFYYTYRKKERLNLGETHIDKSAPEDGSDLEKKRLIEKMMETAEATLQEIGKARWYDETLFRLYVDGGCNSTKISRDTGIPRASIVLTINRVLARIREALNEKI